MRKFILRVLNKLVHLMSESAPNESNTSVQETQESIQAKRVTQWFKDNGDKTLRLNYDLNPMSLVFDLGGYEGQWASDIYSMYNCKILIFEPYLPFAQNIKFRFKNNHNIQTYEFGLGARTEKVGFSVLDNSSTMFQTKLQNEAIDIVSVADFLRENSIQSVDLVKINIEGAEYELLECLLNNDLICIFKNIQVQFHDFIVEDAEERMKAIQNKLSLTHELTYHYNFVWDNWKIKNEYS
jgi:FkbM family methyltransferase